MMVVAMLVTPVMLGAQQRDTMRTRDSSQVVRDSSQVVRDSAQGQLDTAVMRRDSVRTGVDTAAARSDTLLDVPRDSAGLEQRGDTLVKGEMYPQRADSTGRGVRTEVSEGRLEQPSAGTGAANAGFSKTQARSLQRALREAGCDPGPVDGIVGPMTERAIACARNAKNVSGDDMNSLLRALELDFTVPEP
jgi:hypothetical protein